MPYFIPTDVIILGAIAYIVAPVLMPVAAGYLCGLGMLRISTLGSTWVGVTVGVATACVNLGWAKLMVSILKWTAVLGGIPWILMLGAIPVFLLLGILATGLLCGRLDRMRGECDPPYDPPALRPAGHRPTTGPADRGGGVGRAHGTHVLLCQTVRFRLRPRCHGRSYAV